MPVDSHADDCYKPKTVESKIQNRCCLLEFWQQDCDLLKNPIFLLNVTRTDKTVRYVSPQDGRRLKRSAGRRLAGGARASYSMQLLSVDFSGRELHLLLVLQAGLAEGPLLWLASPPCRGISGLLKGQTHREKLRKGELKGRSHIYHTSLHDTTLVHVCVSFTCPGRHSEGQEHGLQRDKRRRQHPGPPPLPSHPRRPRPRSCCHGARLARTEARPGHQGLPAPAFRFCREAFFLDDT